MTTSGEGKKMTQVTINQPDISSGQNKGKLNQTWSRLKKDRNKINDSQRSVMENRPCQRKLISFLDEIQNQVDKGNCCNVTGKLLLSMTSWLKNYHSTMSTKHVKRILSWPTDRWLKAVICGKSPSTKLAGVGFCWAWYEARYDSRGPL